MDLTKERQKKCSPIAKEILKIISDKCGDLGETDNKKLLESFKPATEDTIELFLKNDIKLEDTGYIMTLLHQAVECVDNILTNSMARQKMKIDSELWGKEIRDITYKDIDEKLKLDKNKKK